ncbi:MAG TPA: hypothetical protein VGS12_07720 [Caulobacteraceae bacterium]|nr:hypothetical protein [Caulobacteraceae bacterium]
MTAFVSGPAGGWRPRQRGRLRRLGRIAVVVAALALPAAPPAFSQPTVAALPPTPAVPQGVWLMEGRVAVQIFECEGLMCGRIVWRPCQSKCTAC